MTTTTAEQPLTTKERTDELVETMALRSRRIEFGASKMVDGKDHGFFKDGVFYLTLCTKGQGVPYKAIVWSGEAPKNPCQSCVAYMEAILVERNERRRKKEAERRRERYHSDPSVKQRVKDTNKAYLQRKKQREKKPEEVFDEQFRAYEAKWSLEDDKAQQKG